MIVWLMCAAFAWAGDPAAKVAGKDALWLERALPKASKDGALRAAIVAEMGTVGDPALLMALLRAARDRDEAVRCAAIESLARFGPAMAEPERDAVYVEALSDDHSGVVEAARDALVERWTATDPLVADLVARVGAVARQEGGWQGRAAAVRALERVTGATGEGVDAVLVEVARLDAHPEVRRSAAVALGSRGASGATEVLHRLRTVDPDESVRMAAEEAIRRIGAPITTVVLAVMPFDTRITSVRSFAQGLQDYFTSAVSAARVATVVERAQVDKVLAELRFQGAYIDDGKALQVGKLLRAGQVVTGSVQVTGDEVTCLAKRIDVASGEVWAAPPAVGALHDLGAVQRACATRLVGTF